MKQIVNTEKAPKAIGCYSQAVKVGNTVYLSGQIGFIPDTMGLATGIDAQCEQVFKNLTEVINAAGGKSTDVVKVTIYLTEMANFSIVNQVMAKYFNEPYPARAAVGVKELPRGALVEADAIMVLNNK